MEAEQVLYDRWEAETGAEKMSWVGELVGYPVEETNLWVMALGEKVAAMGCQLELIAVFGAERVTLVREPRLAENPIDTAFRARFDEQELGDELPNPDGESDNNDARSKSQPPATQPIALVLGGNASVQPRLVRTVRGHPMCDSGFQAKAPMPTT